MFNVDFTIDWPKSSRWGVIFNKDWSLSKNKAVEVNFYKTSHIINFHLNAQFVGVDHAGASVSIGLVGLSLEIRLYDSRHWNYNANRWMTEEEFILEMKAE
jgi:hypothetical protein